VPSKYIGGSAASRRLVQLGCGVPFGCQLLGGDVPQPVLFGDHRLDHVAVVDQTAQPFHQSSSRPQYPTGNPSGSLPVPVSPWWANTPGSPM
jgi:hypothetical protein